MSQTVKNRGGRLIQIFMSHSSGYKLASLTAVEDSSLPAEYAILI